MLARLRDEFPPVAQPILLAGVRRLIDYQDTSYADEYLQRMAELRQLDADHGGAAKSWSLTLAAARHLAVAMSYDDVIRVADLKTRGSRFERVAKEVGVLPGQVLHTTEFTHPRLAEICATLPAALGRRLERSAWLSAWIEKRFVKGKRIASATLWGFLQLYVLAGMRRFRRGTLRHQLEVAQIRRWMDQVIKTVAADYDLAVEIVHCRRLVKGYSGTAERGEGNFASILSAAEKLLGKSGAAAHVRSFRDAALADEKGLKLQAAMATCFGECSPGKSEEE